MVGRILYRESVQGVLKYVFGKSEMRVLGFQNTYSETDTGKLDFMRILHHLGNRHDTKKKYVHISLNIPHGEYLDDINFYELSKNYMEHMGYGEQPYVVVRHFDTKHQHVHIVSTTVKEDGKLLDFSFEYRRNLATQKHLELQYGLSPSPETKANKGLPLYRIPEIKMDDSQGVKFYIQDILNNILLKYKVRSFEELAFLVKPYHVVVKPISHHRGSIGVSYGIAINNGYKSRFIDGYVVHPRLSGPKLQIIFARHSHSKLLQMHRKRLEKQIKTSFDLFRSINAEDLPEILMSHQKLDCKVDYNEMKEPVGFTIYDKSGYIFKSSEISPEIGFETHPTLINGTVDQKTRLNLNSQQLVLEVRKLIKNTFYKAYLESDKSKLLSSFVLTKNAKDLLSTIMASESHQLLTRYQPKDQNKILGRIIFSEFEPMKNMLHLTESKKEMDFLEQRASLLKQILAKSIFDLNRDHGIPFDLFQSMGVKYSEQKISYLNSNKHSVPFPIGKLRLPDREASYVSTGFVNENFKILDGLVHGKNYKEMGLGATAMFLPVMFPRLFDAMAPDYRQTFERLSLKSFQLAAEKSHIPYEKSPLDYIRLFNSKGFYFERKGDYLRLCSIYSKYPISIPITAKTQTYLNSIKDLENVLGGQFIILDKIKNQNQGYLKNLWSSYLLEKGLYNKAAFLLVNDGIRPNLPLPILKYHMENGLRERILSFSGQNIDRQHASFLRKSVYAFSALLGPSRYKQEEVFNAFRDELTDYSKYKSTFF